MGSIHLRKDGKTYQIEESATGAQVKKILNLPPDSVLVNARNQMILDNEKIGDKVRDGESIAARPKFKYWNW